MPVLIAALAVAVAFAFVNGLHDAANAMGPLVATRAARPGPAVLIAAGFNLLGPLVIGTAVASTIAGIVHVPSDQLLPVAAAGISGALIFNLATWWLGLPVSASRGLVGGLAGAALAQGGPADVRWGGLSGLRPVGVTGVLVWLVISPVIALALGALGIRIARVALRRASRSVSGPLRAGQWLSSAALAFTHGANDAQKTMGVMVMLLLGSGDLMTFRVPVWVRFVAAGAIAIGTSLGGWRVVRTVGSGIYRLRSLEGLVSQGVAAAVVGAAAGYGAPISTSDAVAPAIMGIGLARRRRHVHWGVARDIGFGFLLTIPASGLLAAGLLPLWRWAS
jgi:inorganic phosphate transporter, PiT family